MSSSKELWGGLFARRENLKKGVWNENKTFWREAITSGKDNKNVTLWGRKGSGEEGETPIAKEILKRHKHGKAGIKRMTLKT